MMNGPSGPRKILIFGHSNIGDACYDLAVVSALHRRFPKAEIAFLTSLRARNVVEHYPGIGELIVYDRKYRDRGLRKRLALIRALSRKGYDLAVTLKKSWMARFLGIPQRWDLEPFLKGRPPEHLLDTYLGFLRSRGIETDKAAFDFRFTGAEKAVGDRILEANRILPGTPLAAILPAAAWSLKGWPTARWNALAEALKTRFGVRSISVAKPGGRPADKAAARELSPEIVRADKTSLREAMALIQRCRLFIGPDSSLLHLASCMGVESIGLYGPTSPGKFYPYFHKENTVTTDRKLDCMPCYPRFENFPCGKEPHRLYGVFMESLSVEKVLAAAEGRLQAVGAA